MSDAKLMNISGTTIDISDDLVFRDSETMSEKETDEGGVVKKIS